MHINYLFIPGLVELSDLLASGCTKSLLKVRIHTAPSSDRFIRHAKLCVNSLGFLGGVETLIEAL